MPVPPSRAERAGDRTLRPAGPTATRNPATGAPAFSGLAPGPARRRVVGGRSWREEGSRSVDAPEPLVRGQAVRGLHELRQSVEGVTLVTTNRTLAEIGTSFGDPVASRLAAACLWLDVTGSDERRRAA